MAAHLRAVPGPPVDHAASAPAPAWPPGPVRDLEPPALPGPDAPSAVQGVLLHRHPELWLTRWQRRFGDVFVLRLPLTGPVVVVADPAAAAHLVHADPGVARAGEARRRVMGMVSAGSVLGGDDSLHRAARQALAPAFSEPAVTARRGQIQAIAAAHVATWPRERPARLLPRMRALTDHVMVSAMLGVHDPERGRRLALAVRRMLQVAGNSPLPVPSADQGVLGSLVAAGFERRSRGVAALVAQEALGRGPAGTDSGDVLDRLVERTADGAALAEQVLPLLMAGQEPAAAALTWVLERAAWEPRAAADAFVAEDGSAEAFVTETLRLRPPVHAVLRRLTAPVRVAGLTLPAGSCVMLPTVLLHRDPRSFPAAGVFRPRRWADEGEAPGFVPFGGGSRRCLGEALAREQLDVVVPEVLRRVRLRALAPRPERMVLRATVTVPRRGALVRMTRR